MTLTVDDLWQQRLLCLSLADQSLLVSAAQTDDQHCCAWCSEVKGACYSGMLKWRVACERRMLAMVISL